MQFLSRLYRYTSTMAAKKKGRAKQRTKKTLQEREEKTEAVAGEVK